MALFILVLTFCSSVLSQKPDDAAVLIPAGEFTMGKNTTGPSDWQPEHKIKISSFYMDKHEVTNQQYYDFCLATNNPLPEFWGIREFRSGTEFPDLSLIHI